jgi:hypothetical protein
VAEALQKKNSYYSIITPALLRQPQASNLKFQTTNTKHCFDLKITGNKFFDIFLPSISGIKAPYVIIGMRQEDNFNL